jgi:hypothetical protein
MTLDPVSVLTFDLDRGFRSMGGAHVNHGLFWPDAGTTLGPFCWDAWVTASVRGVLLKDGYGDAHALTWGAFSGLGGETGWLSGSVWNGTENVPFTGSESLHVGEWYHLAVAWDGTNVYTYVNGIPDSVTPFAGPRMSAPRVRGAGPLYVGMGWQGGIAFIRGWDRGVNPLGGGRQLQAFVPERFPGRYFNGVPCDFYCDYTRPGQVLFDSSPQGADAGLGRCAHHGRLGSLLEGGLADEETPFTNTLLTNLGVPYWVADDPSCPFGRALGTAGQIPGKRHPAPVPARCLAFDSFGRADGTMASYVNTALGQTEGGSIGPLTWQTGDRKPPVVMQNFGLLGGAAVCLSPTACVAWVPIGTPAQDVRVERSPAPANPGETGLAFRVEDAENYWSAYYAAAGTRDGPGDLHVVLTVGGASTLVKKFPVASRHFDAIRVVAVGSTITMFTGNSAGAWTRVGELTGQTAIQSARGAGLSNDRGEARFSALMRFKNWTVFSA